MKFFQNPNPHTHINIFISAPFNPGQVTLQKFSTKNSRLQKMIWCTAAEWGSAGAWWARALFSAVRPRATAASISSGASTLMAGHYPIPPGRRSSSWPTAGPDPATSLGYSRSATAAYPRSSAGKEIAYSTPYYANFRSSFGFIVRFAKPILKRLFWFFFFQILRDRLDKTTSDRGQQTPRGYDTGRQQNSRLQKRMPVDLCVGNQRSVAAGRRMQQRQHSQREFFFFFKSCNIDECCNFFLRYRIFSIVFDGS